MTDFQKGLALGVILALVVLPMARGWFAALRRTT